MKSFLKSTFGPVLAVMVLFAVIAVFFVRSSRQVIVGSVVAFTPNYCPSNGLQCSPYTCDDGKGGTKIFQLGADSCRYHEFDWYVRPLKARRAGWSDLYFDEDGGLVWMSAYSVPIADLPTNLYAALTAGLSPRQLMDFVFRIRPFGCAGHNPPVIIHPDDTADFLKVKRSPLTGAMSGVCFDLQTVRIGSGRSV